MGISFKFGGRLEEQYDDELVAFAGELGLGVSGEADSPKLRGVIDGHRIDVRLSRLQRCRIEASFNSGLERLRVFERSSEVKTNLVEGPPTGDTKFDADYRVMVGKKAGPQDALEYLTPERREVIMALGDAFTFGKVEDDELRVFMDEHPPIGHLREAIGLTVLAAKALQK